MYKPKPAGNKGKAPLTLQQQLAGGQKAKAAREANHNQGRKRIVDAPHLPHSNPPPQNGAAHVSANKLLSLLTPAALPPSTSLTSQPPAAPPTSVPTPNPSPQSFERPSHPTPAVTPSSMQTNRQRVMGSSIFNTEGPLIPHRPTPPPSSQSVSPPPTFLPLAHTQYPSLPPSSTTIPDLTPTPFCPPLSTRAVNWGGGQRSLTSPTDEREARKQRQMEMKAALDDQINSRSQYPPSVLPLPPPDPPFATSAFPFPPTTSRAPPSAHFTDNRSFQQGSSVFGGRAEDADTRRLRVREETQAALRAQIDEKRRKEEERKQKEAEEERKWEDRIERERKELANRAAGVPPPPPSHSSDELIKRDPVIVEEKQQLSVSSELPADVDVKRRHRRSSHRSYSDSDSDSDGEWERHRRSRRHRRRRSPSRSSSEESHPPLYIPEPTYVPQPPSPQPPPAPAVRPPFGVRSLNTKAAAKASVAPRRGAVPAPLPPAVSEKVRKQMVKADNLARGKSVIGGTQFVDRKWRGKAEPQLQQGGGRIPGDGGEVKGTQEVWNRAEDGDGEMEELVVRLDTGLSMDRLHSTSEWLFPHSLGLPSYRA